MPRKHGIPRHRAYQCGIASAGYDLEHMVIAFGLRNVIDMATRIHEGRKQDVARMLRKWTLHQYGPEYSMIDEMCNTSTEYGLTARTAAVNGASTASVDD